MRESYVGRKIGDDRFQAALQPGSSWKVSIEKASGHLEGRHARIDGCGFRSAQHIENPWYAGHRQTVFKSKAAIYIAVGSSSFIASVLLIDGLLIGNDRFEMQSP
jgi:hypothetical protein